MTREEKITCPLCSCLSSTFLFNKNGYSFVSCSECGHVYVPIKPDLEFLEKLYSGDYYCNGAASGYGDYIAERRAIESTAKSRLKRLSTFGSGSRNLLEIGCGLGFFLNVAKDLFHVKGVELSDFSSDYAKKCFNLDVYQGALDKASFLPSSFDIVVMWDVIEHTADPVGLISEIKRVLRPGGILVFTTPSTSSLLCMLQKRAWRLFDPPFHLNYFNIRNAVKMLNSAGFKVLKTGLTWEWHSLRYLFHAVNVYYNNGLLKKAEKFLLSSPLAKINLPTSLFDIMIVHAIKKH